MIKRSRFILIPLILLTIIILSSCAMIQTKDPMRSSLYAIKSEWLAIREYVIIENLEGRITDVQLEKFRAIDYKFQSVYDLARDMYLEKENINMHLQTLKNLLLQARREFYRGGQ